MRWSSVFAAGLVAAALVLCEQPSALSASRCDETEPWQADIAMDDGEPSEVSPQSFEALRARLEPDDPVAALEAVGYALNEVGDGATYVWHRTDGPLMGNVRMTGSYLGSDGKICRRLTLTLVLGDVARPADAVACRDADGHWVLGG